MKKDFVEKILHELIVDTKQYRYIRKDCKDVSGQWVEIRRLSLKDLDTTAAIDGWKTVYDSRKP